MSNFKPLVVFFSSVSENTSRFMKKTDLRSYRIPLKGESDKISEPYILIVPTYGGGESMSLNKNNNSRPVPPQVRNFLRNHDNYYNMRGVITTGNINFGEDYGKAGKVISDRFNVPLLYMFELMGNENDIIRVQQGINDYYEDLVARGQWFSSP